MITSIKIDGFKSLRNFKMDFRPGLNVLAGPNGSGKTNILQALGLLSYIYIYEPNQAMQRGIEEYGNMFSFDNESQLISYKINGTFLVDSWEYEISFSIGLADSSFKLLAIAGIVREMILDTNIDYIPINLQRSLEEHLSASWIQSGDQRDLNYISSDLAAFFDFSLRPDKLKKRSNIKSRPMLESDGSNLDRTILDILEKRVIHQLTTLSKKDLLNYINLLPMEVADIKDMTRKSSVSVDLDWDIMNAATQTLESFSDGTLVWIGICTALLTYPGTLAFDEPDRHLHPDMLAKMVSLFRDHAEEGPGWLLMTTHNETVLNCCDVDEVQVVYLNDKGHTRVGPIHDPENLKDVIYRSGRGVGSFYVSGSVVPEGSINFPEEE